ncbi:hypothetical protein [Croceicoccus marinus]|jgi:hypothetical protein|uniref:DUF2188 domain-containing protein n=1 Tax=Croceicoccus marinus TaxID=450378 RepID=A0A7G6VSH3_9SPHN|nr:hypothetical protein [Croceicoccus marinus]QNE04688.1 hypothetical protein H4O24_12085 [Croceicoccus marinus]QNE05421.1 hypothetical protein H4O24_01550 [Croceicoccus marinus]
MTYRVIFYRDGNRLADAAWTGSFAEAQTFVRESLESLAFNKVVVLNDDGKVVLTHSKPIGVLSGH